jgi:hypothetical protein
MKWNYLLCGLFLFLKPETHRIAYHIDPQSRFVVNGTSNVNKFRCICDDPFPAGQLVASVHPDNRSILFSQAFLKIPAKGIDCSNRIMNRELYRYIKAEEFPFIEIELIRAVPKGNQFLSELTYNRSYFYEAETFIRLAGVKQSIPVSIEIVKLNSRQIQLIAHSNILMSRFRLKPKNMIQLFKVRDQINIRFNLTITLTEYKQQQTSVAGK